MQPENAIIQINQILSNPIKRKDNRITYKPEQRKEVALIFAKLNKADVLHVRKQTGFKRPDKYNTLMNIIGIETKKKKPTQKPAKKSKQTKPVETIPEQQTADIEQQADIKRINFNIDAKMFKQISIYSIMENTTITELLRKLINEYIQKQTKIPNEFLSK